MRTLLVAIVIVASLSAARGAKAETIDTTTAAGFGLTLLYIAPVGTSLFAITINSTYLAYDQGAPRRWHVIGYASGAADLVLGTSILVFGDQSDGATILGGVPIVLGAAAVTTAYFVDYPDDVVGDVAIAPLVGSGLAGLAIGGTF